MIGREQLNAVEAGLLGAPRRLGVAVDTSSISASLIRWLPSESWNEGRAEGDQPGMNELSKSPCWPTW